MSSCVFFGASPAAPDVEPSTPDVEPAPITPEEPVVPATQPPPSQIPAPGRRETPDFEPGPSTCPLRQGGSWYAHLKLPAGLKALDSERSV